MKKRNITYGYHIVEGELLPHPEESAIVQEIFRRYAAGESLRTLAEDLTSRRVEFFPGKSGWDKARVKRVLDERRYLGERDFPPLIDAEHFKVTEEKKKQAAPSTEGRDEILREIRPLLACDACGGRLLLRSDKRLTPAEAWHCPACKVAIRLSHEELKERLFKLQQQMLTDPSSIREDQPQGIIVSLEAKKITHELHRRMDAGSASEEELIQMALQCAAETYQDIHSARHITDRLTAVLQSAGPLSALDTSLLRATARQIHLAQTGEIALLLKNGRLYKEERAYDRNGGS